MHLWGLAARCRRRGGMVRRRCGRGWWPGPRGWAPTRRQLPSFLWRWRAACSSSSSPSPSVTPGCPAPDPPTPGWSRSIYLTTQSGRGREGKGGFYWELSSKLWQWHLIPKGKGLNIPQGLNHRFVSYFVNTRITRSQKYQTFHSTRLQSM